MKLSKLFATDNNTEITGLGADSRAIKPGYLFFAIRGKNSDGHNYIAQAIQNGAVAIIGENPAVILPVPYLISKNIRHDLAIAAASFYTAKPKKICVVTGTNGKTSVADFTRQFWELDGKDAASVGTLGFIKKAKIQNLEADNTSPDPVVLNELLTHAKDAAIIEGSSIGLDQHRLDGLKISAAAFTNFTRDHLDYHTDMENYFRAKTLLFSQVMQEGVAVLNSDIPEYERLKIICEQQKHEIITFGEYGDLQLVKATPSYDGQVIALNIFNYACEFKIPLAGKFQTENILCALGLVIACGMSQEKALSYITKLKPIPGRMQQAAPGIFVDYAHTPDALKNALTSLRAHTKGKLIMVFGCGGDRDKGKRPEMGKIANAYADVVIVTDDNPRTEDAATIRQQILATCAKAAEIADRENAIKTAVSQMHDDDILLIAGKGHEKYQIIGKDKQHFDDVEVVKKYSVPRV
jgi:UDP-N-acetylmuramoyl-L-alanyl-D-glutamate--2,6-diaminopimelate ligase